MSSSAIDCDVTSRTKTEWVTPGWCVKIVAYIVIFAFIMPFVRNKKCMYSRGELFLCSLEFYFGVYPPSLLRNSGNKHQNNPLLSVETVRHLSTYIILYVSFAMEDMDFHKGTYILNTQELCKWFAIPCVSCSLVEANSTNMFEWHSACTRASKRPWSWWTYVNTYIHKDAALI